MKKRKWLFPVLIAALALLFLLSLCMGRFGVPLKEASRILASSLGIPLEETWAPAMEAAVLRIRLPRVLLAMLVGCCLSAAGTCYQGVFQNPMAAPDLLGASSGAAFGAALAILLRLSGFALTAMAFLFSLLTILLVALVAAKAPGKKVVNLILAGVMVSSLFSSATSCVKLVADPNDQLPQITYWLMGSLSGTALKDVLFGIIPMAAGLIPLFLLRWRMNLLTLDEDEARSMGVNTGLLRAVVILCSTLITAAAVSLSGMIGWVGLVVPHLCRKAAGNDYRRLLPASMLAGGLFLLLADDVSRNLLSTEIPIGILTAFIGAPFFLYLITRKETTL